MEAIKANPLFRGLDDRHTQELLDVFKASCRSYRKGETLLTAGTSFSHFGLVLEGLVQVYMYDLGGNEMILANVQPGVTFGEAHCYLKTPEPGIWVRAEADSRVLWLSCDGLRQPVNNAGIQAAARFTVLLAERMLSQKDRVQILTKLTLREKLMTFFAQYADNGQSCFTVPFDRAGMAAYLGTERSALSRELSRMKKEGLLDYRHNEFHLHMD